MPDARTAGEIRRDPDHWRTYDHDQLAERMALEVAVYEDRIRNLRHLMDLADDRWRCRLSGLWVDGRQGARVMHALRQAQRDGRKTLRVADLLEVARDG